MWDYSQEKKKIVLKESHYKKLSNIELLFHSRNSYLYQPEYCVQLFNSSAFVNFIKSVNMAVGQL